MSNERIISGEFAKALSAEALKMESPTMGDVVAEIAGPEVLDRLDEEFKTHTLNPWKTVFLVPNDFWGKGLDAGLEMDQLNAIYERAKEIKWGVFEAVGQKVTMELGLKG